MAQMSNKRLKITLLVLCLCVSCAPPVVTFSRFEWQENWLYNPETGRIKNFLSIFIQVEGINPQRTFPQVLLEAVGHDLSWKIALSSEDPKQKSSSYVGGVLTAEELLPVGTYKLTLHDERGLIATELFTLPKSSVPAIEDFPKLENSRLRSKTPAVLIVYHYDNFFLATDLDPMYTLPKREMGEAFYVYSLLPGNSTGLVSGPYTF